MPNANLKFEPQPFHRNIPSPQLLADLRRVADDLHVATLTQADYRKHAKFNPLTLSARFGSWNAALSAAGLKQSRHFRVPAEAVLADVRRVAEKLQTRHLLETQYVFEGKYSITLIYRHFKSWTGVTSAAGLDASTYQPRATDQSLFDNLEQVWRTLNRQPKCTELYPPLSRFGLTPYQRRFGGWQNAIDAFIKFKDLNPTAQLPSDNAMIPRRKTTRTIGWSLRYQVLQRDQFKCQACGQSPATDPQVILEIDHKTPWSKGGETILENLQCLCKQCNGGKSNL